MTTDKPTVRQWQEIFSPAAASPADRSAAEPDITAMRSRLREAVNACTDLAMDQAVLILENHRLRRLLRQAEQSRQAWADLAYDMWALLGSSVPAPEANRDDYATKRGLLRRRLNVMIEQKPPASFGPHAADHGPGTWSPQPDADGNLTLAEAIGQALGTASVCWVGGTGSLEFDSITAAHVYDGLMAFLSDWSDDLRKQANEGTAAKLLARENWT